MEAYRGDRPGPVTIEELDRLPEDEYRYDLVRGWLVREPPPGARHGEVAFELALRLGTHVKAARLGRVFAAETGFVLSESPPTVRGPDLAFVARDRIPPGPAPDQRLRLAPDLVVEVVSPSNRWTEIAAKVRDYLDAGSRLVWIVDPPARTVTVHRPGAAWIVRGEDDALDGEDVLPGFRIRVGEIFDLE